MFIYKFLKQGILYITFPHSHTCIRYEKHYFLMGNVKMVSGQFSCTPQESPDFTLENLADLCFHKSEYLDSYHMLLLTCGYIVCSFEEGEKQNGVYYMQQPHFPFPCVRVVVISQEVICAVTFSECRPFHVVISNIFLSTSQENSAWGRVPFASQCRLPFKTFLCCFS